MTRIEAEKSTLAADSDDLKKHRQRLDGRVAAHN